MDVSFDCSIVGGLVSHGDHVSRGDVGGRLLLEPKSHDMTTDMNFVGLSF